MTTGLQERVIDLVTRELGADPGAIGPTTTSDDVEAWDSLGHLQVCMAVEAEFHVTLELDELASLDSVPAIVALLERGSA